MELKLMVIAHKKDFGSTLSFSKNVNYDEKELLKSVKYTNYSPYEDKIIEVEAGESCLYFVTFIGGHDEFGREYHNVISAVFSFQLNSDDLYELRQSFDSLKEEINSDHFNLNKKQFSRISKRIDNKTSDNMKVKFNPSKLIKNLVFTFLLSSLILYTVMLAFDDNVLIISLKSKFSSKKEKDILDIMKRYSKFKEIFEKEDEDLIKYRLYMEFLEREKQFAKIYLEKSDDKYFQKIKQLNLEDYYEAEKNLEIIDNYLEIKEFSKNRKDVLSYRKKIMEKFDRDAYKKIESRILKYNNNINNNDLFKLIEECNLYLKDMEDGEYRNTVTRILANAEEMKRGKSLELEIYIVDKSYVFNNREIEIKMTSNRTKENTYKKRKKVDTERDIYVGSFYNYLKLDDEFQVEVSIYRSGGRQEDMKSFNIGFGDLNKLVKVQNKSGNGFKLEIKVNSDVFKIKY